MLLKKVAFNLKQRKKNFDLILIMAKEARQAGNI